MHLLVEIILKTLLKTELTFKAMLSCWNGEQRNYLRAGCFGLLQISWSVSVHVSVVWWPACPILWTAMNLLTAWKQLLLDVGCIADSPSNRAIKPKRMAGWFNICQIIRNNANNTVTLALKSHFRIIIKNLNLIDNRMLHTMIHNDSNCVCCALYILRYRHDFEIDFSFNLSYSSYEIALI